MPLRYVVARPGRKPERVTYVSPDVARRWAAPGELVIPVTVVRIGPFADRIEALDDFGAAALEGVFLEGRDG